MVTKTKTIPRAKPVAKPNAARMKARFVFAHIYEYGRNKREWSGDRVSTEQEALASCKRFLRNNPDAVRGVDWQLYKLVPAEMEEVPVTKMEWVIAIKPSSADTEEAAAE